VAYRYLSCFGLRLLLPAVGVNYLWIVIKTYTVKIDPMMTHPHTAATGNIPGQEMIAGLLGLSREEYQQLSHSGIRPIAGLDGAPMQYYMEVSRLNPEDILVKLPMNRQRMIYFSPDAFHA